MYIYSNGENYTIEEYFESAVGKQVRIDRNTFNFLRKIMFPLFKGAYGKSNKEFVKGSGFAITIVKFLYMKDSISIIFSVFRMPGKKPIGKLVINLLFFMAPFLISCDIRAEGKRFKLGVVRQKKKDYLKNFKTDRGKPFWIKIFNMIKKELAKKYNKLKVFKQTGKTMI